SGDRIARRRVEHCADDGQRFPPRLLDLAQLSDEALRPGLLGVLEEELPVAQDVVDRRAQLVPDASTELFPVWCVAHITASGAARSRVRAEERVDLGEQAIQLDGLGVEIVAAGGERFVAVA